MNFAVQEDSGFVRVRIPIVYDYNYLAIFLKQDDSETNMKAGQWYAMEVQYEMHDRYFHSEENERVFCVYLAAHSERDAIEKAKALQEGRIIGAPYVSVNASYYAVILDEEGNPYYVYDVYKPTPFATAQQDNGMYLPEKVVEKEELFKIYEAYNCLQAYDLYIQDTYDVGVKCYQVFDASKNI